MFKSFRLAMTWVHTWFGLVLGFVLMAAFFFGALSVFDREIDRWAIPESRLRPDSPAMPSFDRVLLPLLQRMQPKTDELERLQVNLRGLIRAHFDTVRYWSVYTNQRDPVVSLYAGYELPNARNPEDLAYAQLDIAPRTGGELGQDRLRIGTGFFYPLHFNLTLYWMDLGAWVVGLSALVMLAALVSGVVMHHKVFREFFTLRPKKAIQRSTLDLHNLTGVAALPFHFFFAFTGLVIFAGIYFPVTHTQLEPLHDLHEQGQASQSPLPVRRAGVAAPLASVDAMMAEAQRRWAARGNAGEVGVLVLTHVGDLNGYVTVYRADSDRVAAGSHGIHFRAATGELLLEDPPITAVGSITGFLSGLHLVHFQHWLLRWLYVLGGLMGCVCIATGFIFFVEKRKQRHAKAAAQGSRLVDALAVTTVTGMLVATLAILIANRLMPSVLPSGWPARARLEQYLFWAAWLMAAMHAFWRGAPVARGRMNPAWREQCRAVAVMAVAAVLLNWFTTGDHLLKTLGEPYWPVAGVDLFLLVSAALSALAARRIRTGGSAAERDRHEKTAHA